MKSLISIFTFLLLITSGAAAQSDAPAPADTPAPIDLSDSLFVDSNGDGIVKVLAFGDSITRGVGDFTDVGETVHREEATQPVGEAGYPLRLEQRLGLGIDNLGVPGEAVHDRGLPRFASTIPGAQADVVIIAEGSNDAESLLSSNEYFELIQTMINIARASGTLPIIATLPPACCEHNGLQPFIDSFNRQLHALSVVNGVPLADINHAFENTCTIDHCELLNLPEGLHPNTAGYDVMSETILATVFQIDLFAADGPMTLESLLGLEPGSVTTKPDLVPAS